MSPIIYEVLDIGAGTLSVMAMPAGGESIDQEFSGLQRAGVDHVVSLLDVDEQLEVGLADEESFCFKYGMRYTSFPIIDREVPQRDDAAALVSNLHRDVRNGEHLVIHCRAGIGRTGVIASAVLIQAGYSAGEAIHLVSFARGALIPDTEEQDNWIKSFEHLS